MSDTPFDSAATPRLFSIPPDRSFLAELAQTLYDDAARQALFGPCALHEAHILVPTRRAARHLAFAFLRLAEETGHDALLLPRIGTLGDLDEDVPQIGRAPLDVPPAIPAMARHFHLLKLVRAWAGTENQLVGGQLNPVKLSALAFELAAFLDQAQNEQLDWSRLPDLVPEELAKNWQQTLDFLTIITQAWPDHLAENDCLDPTARRNLLLANRASYWGDSPPDYPVIAAGSTGSIRATADLMRVIAHLPKGAVVLPGLDFSADATVWRHIEKDVAHPQYGMAQTLQHMEVTRDGVQDWPSALSEPSPEEAEAAARIKRVGQVNRALVPAAMTALWTGGQGPHETGAEKGEPLAGLHMIDAPDARAEAGMIGLLMRETLNTPDKTAALVTRDRKLARRVAAELQRWGIQVDDSAGMPLTQGPVSIWLRHILACAAEDFAPVALLALLKHRQTCLRVQDEAPEGDDAHIDEAQDRAAHLRAVHQLEAAILRGVRPPATKGQGLAGLKTAAQAAGLDTRLLDALAAAFAPLTELATAAPMAAHIEALMAVAQALSHPTKPVPAQDEEGRALAALMEQLSAHSDLAGDIEKPEWPALFDMWLARESLRAQGPTHERLHIWGPLEARLMQTDVMILGGLNETVWPPMPETGPWLSRPMRAALQMSQPERQIGLAAHDFVQGTSAPLVYVTRAEKIDNAPSVAARWLRRLETLFGKQPRDEQNRLLAWWRSLDHNQGAGGQAAKPPAPCPPLAARPARLSVTQIETLLHNPYEIYAKKILRLRPWDAVDAPPHAGHRGTLIHSILEQLVARGLHQSDAVAEAVMQLAEELQGQEPGGTAILAYWQARLQAVGAWLAAHHAAQNELIEESFVEQRGQWEMMIEGAPFTLSAIADRIDRRKDGRFDIIDYKTGAMPTQKDVAQHVAPQLTLEAAMLQAGAFPALADARNAVVRCLRYVHVTGREPAGKLMDIVAADDLVDGASHMVHQLIATYRQPKQPYLVHVRPKPNAGGRQNMVDHLARVKEWRSDSESAHE